MVSHNCITQVYAGTVRTMGLNLASPAPKNATIMILSLWCLTLVMLINGLDPPSKQYTYYGIHD